MKHCQWHYVFCQRSNTLTTRSPRSLIDFLYRYRCYRRNYFILNSNSNYGLIKVTSLIRLTWPYYFQPQTSALIVIKINSFISIIRWRFENNKRLSITNIPCNLTMCAVFDFCFVCWCFLPLFFFFFFLWGCLLIDFFFFFKHYVILSEIWNVFITVLIAQC